MEISELRLDVGGDPKKVISAVEKIIELATELPSIQLLLDGREVSMKDYKRHVMIANLYSFSHGDDQFSGSISDVNLKNYDEAKVNYELIDGKLKLSVGMDCNYKEMEY